MKVAEIGTLFIGACLWTMGLVSCQQWGESDPPAGNQKLPGKVDDSPRLKAEYSFDDQSNLPGTPFTLEGGTAPEIIEEEGDETHKGILHLKGSYLQLANPLQGDTLQNGASIMFWTRLAQSGNGPLVCFSDGASNQLYLTAAGKLTYEGTGYLDVNSTSSAFALSENEWHFVAMAFSENGFTVYIDGEEKFNAGNNHGIQSGTSRAVGDGAFDYSKILTLLTTTPYLYIGHCNDGEVGEAYFDDVKVYANLITEDDAVGPGDNVKVPDAVYFNDFSSAAGLNIVGNGRFEDEDTPGFGKVFQNGSGAPRTNYLLLPSDVLSHSAESHALSIGFWISSAKTTGGYDWAPMFMAYGSAPVNGENTWPMMALQYRGVAQVNCAGWCDFTGANNVAGVNTEYNAASGQDWLEDKKWHYYMATFTDTSCKIYFDGELKNEWKVDGVSDGQVVSGLFTAGNTLTYICLGGNQAWDWPDNDAAFRYDDLAVYNVVLSPKQIKAIMNNKQQ